MIDFVPGQLNSSVRGIIELMQGELDELVQQKAALARRARNLRRLLYTISTEGRDPAVSGASALKSRGYRRYRHALKSATSRTVQCSYHELRRACRIALMEAGGTAAPDQIHSLVVRRDSFLFAALNEEPVDAIVRVLNIMAEAGEASRLTKDHYPLFRLTPQVHSG